MTDAESEDVAQIEEASSRVRFASRYDKVRKSVSEVDSEVNTCVLKSVESFVVDARSCKQYAKSNNSSSTSTDCLRCWPRLASQVQALEMTWKSRQGQLSSKLDRELAVLLTLNPARNRTC